MEASLNDLLQVIGEQLVQIRLMEARLNDLEKRLADRQAEAEEAFRP